MHFNCFPGFVKHRDIEPLALILSVKSGAPEELGGVLPTGVRANCSQGSEGILHLPTEKPFKTLASCPGRSGDSTGLRCCCCCLCGGKRGRSGGTTRLPQPELPQAKLGALCEALLEGPRLTTARCYKPRAQVTAREAVT